MWTFFAKKIHPGSWFHVGQGIFGGLSSIGLAKELFFSSHWLAKEPTVNESTSESQKAKMHRAADVGHVGR